MPLEAERNQFRKLIGDFGKGDVSAADVDLYLNDAVYELTMDFTDADGLSAPVTSFDALAPQYKPEVVHYGAINWWWNRASKLVDHHTQNVGQVSQNASEKWDRAMSMIEKLTIKFNDMQSLGTDITIGHLSRFSKDTLQRYGGQSEEAALEAELG